MLNGHLYNRTNEHLQLYNANILPSVRCTRWYTYKIDEEELSLLNIRKTLQGCKDHSKIKLGIVSN